MNRGSGRSGSGAVLGLLLVAGWGTAAAGQRVTETQWTMAGARGGFCVWYLVDPAMAPDLADKGTVFAAAGTGVELPTPLRQTIRDEPRFVNWIPAAICVGLFQTVTIDDEKPVEAKPEEPIAVVTHFIAAQAPRGAAGAGYLLVSLSSNNRTVRNYASRHGLSPDGITIVTGKDRGTTEDRVDFKLEKTEITWIGHPTGDRGVETTRSMSFGYAGPRSSSWEGTLESTPESWHAMVGILRIVGKSSLAKALKASPIRPTGPIETGGTTRLRLRLVPSRGSGGL